MFLLEFLPILSIFILTFALICVFLPNPLFSVLFLLLVFLFLVPFLFYFNLQFIPLFFILIYVGVIIVFFILTLMSNKFELPKSSYINVNILLIFFTKCYIIWEYIMFFSTDNFFYLTLNNELNSINTSYTFYINDIYIYSNFFFTHNFCLIILLSTLLLVSILGLVMLITANTTKILKF